VSGVVVGGKHVPVPGVGIVRSYLQDPTLRLGAKDRRRRRTGWVRSIYVHTSWGLPVKLRSGRGPDLQGDVLMVKRWREDSRCAGAHAAVDCDGSAAVFADALEDAAYHAGEANEVSVGVEVKQTKDGEVWVDQLWATCLIVDAYARALGIQRQFHGPHTTPLLRLMKGGADAVGVFGHRSQTYDRGYGDPGDDVFFMLRDRLGYEQFHFGRGDDLKAWRDRQAGLNGRRDRAETLRVDGVPGPATVAALRRAGREDGLWVPRLAPR
jgi:hypothetical protein